MVYAAALLVGLALAWAAWAPQPFDLMWLETGAASVVVVFALAAWLGLIDREGAPYLRAPRLLFAGAASGRRIVRAALQMTRRAVATEPGLRPALVHIKTRLEGDTERAALGSLIALAPGAVIVDSLDDALLVHALIEEDAVERDVRTLERRIGGTRS